MTETSVCPECGEVHALTFSQDSDGCIRGRNASGQIMHSHLTETAAKLKSARGSVLSVREKRASSDELAEAILDALPPLEPLAQRARELLVRQAARVSSEKGAAAMSAITSLANLIGESFKAAAPAPQEKRIHIGVSSELLRAWEKRLGEIPPDPDAEELPD